MTFFGWTSTRSHTPILDFGRDQGQAPTHVRRVPREYLPLYQYLERRYASLVVLTFEQIESLLGFALPADAAMNRGWWTGDIVTEPQTETWRVTGRLATPNLLARNVAFERPS
jgi:hypothetical protein